MDKVKMIKDPIGGTLTIWLDDPNLEDICTETGEGVILMKDKKNRVIGVEFLHYPSSSASFLVETLVTKTAG